MKKYLGVMALGLGFALAGTTASWAQATGGAGGAGGPSNGTTAGSTADPMKDSKGMSNSTMGSGESMKKSDPGASAPGGQSTAPAGNR